MKAFAEAQPRRFWTFALLLVLVVTAWEVAYWPLNDYPGATWHQTPRGDDIELAQANAAKAGWKQLAGYWVGRMIHGHGYYRPLTSWLFVGEYRLFGTNDRQWAWVNIVLHLGLCLLLAWVVSLWVEGSRLRKAATGVLAAFLVGAPGLADRTVQEWIIGWWPCQPEILSLLCGLGLLAAATGYARTGERRWAVAAAVLFWLAVCFKEMGYVAGMGACLLLVRRRPRWRLLVLLVILGAAFFAFRAWALKDAAGMAGPRNWGNFRQELSGFLQRWTDNLAAATPHLGFMAVGAGLAYALRRRRGRLECGLLAAAVYFAGVSLLVAPPWDGFFWNGLILLWGMVLQILGLVGLGLAVRRWPVPELLGIYLLSWLMVAGFNPVFGWYRYWSGVFGAVLAAISIMALLEFAGRRMRQRAEILQPGAGT